MGRLHWAQRLIYVLTLCAPSQWATTLQCNVIAHWPGACTKWSPLRPIDCNIILYWTTSYHESNCITLNANWTGWLALDVQLWRQIKMLMVEWMAVVTAVHWQWSYADLCWDIEVILIHNTRSMVVLDPFSIYNWARSQPMREVIYVTAPLFGWEFPPP